MRSSCHGVSAAAGKLGAFMGAFVFPYIYDWAGMSALFYVCFVISLLAIAVTIVYIPKGQIAKSLGPEHKSHSSTGSFENGSGYAGNGTHSVANTTGRGLPVSPPRREMNTSPYSADLSHPPNYHEESPLLA